MVGWIVSDALDNVRNQISGIIKTRHPHLPPYSINDEALRKYLKEHKGDIEAITREVVKVIVDRNRVRRRMRLIT